VCADGSLPKLRRVKMPWGKIIDGELSIFFLWDLITLWLGTINLQPCPILKIQFLKRTVEFFENYEIIHGSSWRAIDNYDATFKSLHQMEHSQIPCVKHVISRETGKIAEKFSKSYDLHPSGKLKHRPSCSSQAYGAEFSLYFVVCAKSKNCW
jgi:hypothetical protein